MPPGPAPPQMPERQPIPGVKNLVAIASGKGGVRQTTVAVNLALALAKLGHKVGLLDADVYGPNVPIMLGTTKEPQATADRHIIPVQSQGLKMISMGLLNPGDKPMIWRGPMLHGVITPCSIGPRQIIGLSPGFSRPIEIIFKPCDCTGMMCRSAVACGSLVVPSMIGTFGPYTSASSKPTLWPSFASASARFTATVVCLT